jgi:hypothetical protein
MNYHLSSKSFEDPALPESKLVRQILETHRLKKYEEVLKGLTLMAEELKK